MASIWFSLSPSLRLLCASSFLMSLGFYSLIPILAVHLTDLGWTMSLAGLLLATRQFAQQGFTFAGGALADHWGWRRTLLAGLVLRGMGFMGFAASNEVLPAFVSAAISGFGGALYDPAYKLAYDAFTPLRERARLIAFREVLGNAAFAASALLGIVLAGASFQAISAAAGALYVVVAAMVRFRLPSRPHEAAHRAVLQGIRGVVLDRMFLAYTVLLSGYYYVYMQIYLGVPAAIAQATGDGRGVSAFYMAMAATVILFQLKANEWLSVFECRIRLIGIGTLIAASSLALVPHAGERWQLIVIGAIFSLGTMIANPLITEVVPLFAKRGGNLGAYYGFNGYAVAIGGALSSALGGWVFDLGESLHWSSLPWVVCVLVACASCAGLVVIEARIQGHRRLRQSL